MSGPIDIFISYAHQDQLFRRKLETCLEPLKREGLIQPWSDAAIRPGMEWQEAIGTHLNTAQVILLLISPDFLASDYCYGTEMKRAVGRHLRGDARVIPVILRTTDNWTNAPFGKLQALPEEAKPIKDWRDKDKAYASVVNGIRQAIKELTPPPVESTEAVPRNGKPIIPETSPPVLEAEYNKLEVSSSPGEVGRLEQRRKTSPLAASSSEAHVQIGSQQAHPTPAGVEPLSTPKASKPPPSRSIEQRKPPWKRTGQMVGIVAVVLVVGLVVVTLFLYFPALYHGTIPPPHLSPTSTIPSSPTPPPTGSVNVPVFGFDAQHTHFNPSEHLLSPSNITSLRSYWIPSIGTGIAETFFPSSPAVVNGVVYVGSWDHKLYALDISTRKTLWSAQTGDHITSSPTVVNGIVYIGSWDHKLYAFKADRCSQLACSPLWVSAPTGNSIFSSPVVDNETVYVGSQDGKLYAYKASGCDGNKSSCDPLWSVQMGISITSSPAVDHGVVYIGSWDHKLYALDAAKHTIKWSYPTGDIVWSSPAVANGLVYIGSADKKLYAFSTTGDAQTRAPQWEYTTGSAIHSSPAVANGVVYIGSDDGELYALRASTGKLVWKSAHVEAAFFSSPMVANGLVYLSSNNRTLYVYKALGCGNSQTTCDPLWTSPRLSGPILSSPTVVNGAIYLSSQDGKLYAFH
jgi:outer membrane protein assembly factor BamB